METKIIEILHLAHRRGELSLEECLAGIKFILEVGKRTEGVTTVKEKTKTQVTAINLDKRQEGTKSKPDADKLRKTGEKPQRKSNIHRKKKLDSQDLRTPCPRSGNHSYTGGFCFSCGEYRPSKHNTRIEHLDCVDFLNRNFGHKLKIIYDEGGLNIILPEEMDEPEGS